MMPDGLPEDLRELLRHLDGELGGVYGERYRGLVLFGSYARGEADGGSDVDLLVLLGGEVRSWQEYLRAEPIIWPLSLESGYVLSVFPVNVEDYRSAWKPFLMNARKEGVLLS